jgi:NADH-quinone oxidoreductase subunit M
MESLTFIILCPLIGAALIALTPRNYNVLFRLVALGTTFLSLIGAVRLFVAFTPGVAGIQFEQVTPWVTSLGIAYHVGVDGLNVALVLLAAIVGFAAACAAYEITERQKEFYLLLLVMTGGILGAFASLDVVFFYFFHELALVPTFIMIGVWGRGERRNYAAFNLTIYLSLGALIGLIGLIALYVATGARTFDMVELARQAAAHPLPVATQRAIFPLLLVGFGILASLWPFHTWAPLGYGAAPTSTAMLHAGVLKKFGLYGLIRLALPLLPEATRHAAPLIMILALGNLLYCGLVAMRQGNLNQLIGYSSVAHMGFVFLGIASLSFIGITGAVVVMVAHGLLAALAFAASGYLQRELGTLEMAQMGGLLRKLPFIGTVLVLAMFAGCGLPGFANFVGEVMVLFGAWKGHAVIVVLAAWAALIVGAVYMLRAIRAVLHGPLRERWAGLADAPHLWRKLPFLLLLAGLLIFGCFPGLLIHRIQPAAQAVARAVAGPPAVVAANRVSAEGAR